MVDKELLKILACPVCKTHVIMQENWIVCAQCNRHYPIKDGISVMFIDEAIIPENSESIEGI